MTANVKHDERTHETMERLFTDGVLVNLDVEFWRATRANSEKDLGVKRAELPEFVAGLGTKRLLPKEDVLRWGRYADRARYEIEKVSFKFPVGEGQFVPAAKMDDLVKTLEEIKKEFEGAVDDFLRNYEVRREEYLKRFPEHRRRLEKQYPDRKLLSGKFSFEYSLYSITMPKVIKKQQAEDAAIAKYQAKLDERMNRFLGEAVSALRGQTVELCNSIAERVKNGSLGEGSLNRIREFVGKFKSLNFVGDSQVEAKLEELSRSLATAETYQTDAAAVTSLTNALESVRKIASNIGDVNLITAAYSRRIKS